MNPCIPRFVFKLMLVADSNFKADHVQQQSDGNVWLLDRGEMSANRDEYFSFLASAIEYLTVHSFVAGANANNICQSHLFGLE